MPRPRAISAEETLSLDVAQAEAAVVQAQDALQLARRTVHEAEADLKRNQARLAQAHEAVTSSSKFAPRRLLVAYALWLLFPLAWPGGYLFYLGRDTHCWLQTVTFGGFGI